MRPAATVRQPAVATTATSWDPCSTHPFVLTTSGRIPPRSAQVLLRFHIMWLTPTLTILTSPPFFSRLSCPVPTLPCVQYTSCRQCVLDPFCGYCLSSGCRTGDSAGPTVDSCPDGDWIFNRTTCRKFISFHLLSRLTHHLYDNVAAPPALGSVILADDGAAIYVTFDEPTNRANYYGLFPCSLLVANVSILGSNPVCYWQNALVLVIRLGRDASFAIGEDLTFLPYLIASAGSNDTQNDSNFLTAPISPAINPNSPVVGIEGIF